MASKRFQPPIRKSLTLSLTWLLTAVLFAVTIENIWLDPWLKKRFPDFPSLAPQPPTAPWLITFAAIGIVCVVLMVGQVLLMRRAGVTRNIKIVAGVSVIIALLKVPSTEPSRLDLLNSVLAARMPPPPGRLLTMIVGLPGSWRSRWRATSRALAS